MGPLLRRGDWSSSSLREWHRSKFDDRKILDIALVVIIYLATPWRTDSVAIPLFRNLLATPLVWNEPDLSKEVCFLWFFKDCWFPNLVPSRDEWECSIPIFWGEDWEVPAEHLLDFHDCIHQLQIVHEDVQIKLFGYSLEGISRDWYRSLPISSIISLEYFHAAFHLFCKGIFSPDLLYSKCCHEFNLLNKELNIHEEYVAIGDTSYCDSNINKI